MPRIDGHPAGAPCWIDILTSDQQKTVAFYTQLLGWEAEEPDAQFGGYLNFRKDGVRIAGCMGKLPEMQASDSWGVHLNTSDSRATVERAVAHGSTVIVPPMDVADLGTMASVTDPGGAVVGIWQPGTHRGSGILGEAGAPTWFELHTRTYDESLRFYREVFGWNIQTMSDEPHFRYSILTDGEQRLAGIMDDAVFGPGSDPARWVVYFGTDDADAMADRVQALGGTVVRAPEDTPYGRLAAVTDVNGAAFSIMAPNEAMPFDRAPAGAVSAG